MPISQKPYIGTRDFYPDEMLFRNWMFEKQKIICESYAYKNYHSPILEPLDLYRAKSSEEIVSGQVYSFLDRGEREVAIRPEMTPSLARMASARYQQLNLPERWYNIGNFMRYERPGRGRLREFWQLNVDLLGASGPYADAEIMCLAMEILVSFGAKKNHFTVLYSDRRLIESCIKTTDEEQLRQICRLLDKKEKISATNFNQELQVISNNDKGLISRTNELLDYELDDLAHLASRGVIDENVSRDILCLSDTLTDLGYGDFIKFDASIARGFDYYTGLIFEINDLHPQNNRALFGGGRYDKLIGLFGKNDLPAVGFGMGDVTLENFILAHELLTENLKKRNGFFVSLMQEDLIKDCLEISNELRKTGIPVENSLSVTKKFAKQFELADKKRCRFVVIYGENEKNKNIIQIKDLESGEQTQINKDNISGEIEALL